MRQEYSCIYYNDLVQAVSGTLYRMAPGNLPRKIETIMDKLKAQFDKSERFTATGNLPRTYVSMGKEEFIRSLLFAITEFEELNLSQREYETGVQVNDENRPQFNFVTMYSSIPDVDDFVDLDAATRNIARELERIEDSDQDCFLCIHQKSNPDESTLLPGSGCDKEYCSTCKVNGNLVNNYQSGRTPNPPYTISCKYDCESGYMICCKECKKENECDFKCDSDPENCNNVAARR